MHHRFSFVAALLFLVPACNGGHDPTDSGTSGDTGASDMTAPDGGGTDLGGGSDSGGGTDLGGATDAGPHPDLGHVEFDGGIVGCDSTSGIECDGDWAGQCTPACAFGECCSPQSGHFTCVARDGSGNCPAADLFVDTTRIDGQYTIEWAYFDASDCALMEGCVGASGWRRLLKFDTWTPNIGNADMFLGDPTSAPSGYFTYSACPTHRHYHFNTYAAYEVYDSSGAIAAVGHKQAFCLEDFYHYPGEGDASGAVYDCGYQGIEMGWQDVYGSYLDCQWVDITDVTPGDYTLRIALNTAHILNESNYDNDTATVPVAIPADMYVDPTLACSRALTGTGRDCGWTIEGTHTCTAGAMVTAGCSAACGVGSCTGDTLMRVCEGSSPCDGHGMGLLGTNDDSGCMGRTCGGGGASECCSQVMFSCPPSGQYTVLWAPYDSTAAAVCNVATSP
jgi:hypothetical protein